MEFTAIASGSNGNCYYIGNDEESILIDAGISCKQIFERTAKLNIDLSKIKGVFISHEHSDHVRGLDVFIRKTKIPIYVNKETFDVLKLNVDNSLIKIIDSNSVTQIGDLEVTSFEKIHDAVNPVSFIVKGGGKTISVLTDIGKVCDNTISAIKDSDVIFIESNYDKDMLLDGPYPYFLKERISGGLGHLSNNQAGALIISNANPNLDFVLLSHLSDKNNDPNIALNTFENIKKVRKDLDFKTILTDRFGTIDLFRI